MKKKIEQTINKAIEMNREILSIWEKNDILLGITLSHEDLIKNSEKLKQGDLIYPDKFRNISWDIKPVKEELKDGRKKDLIKLIEKCLLNNSKAAVLIKHEITGTERIKQLQNRYELENFSKCELDSYDSKLSKRNCYIIGFWEY